MWKALLLLPLLAACGDDRDGDGFPADVDCDDHDPDVHPEAEESCNGIDDDCDGFVDEAPAKGSIAVYPDPDGDGIGCTKGVRKACAPPVGWVVVRGDDDCEKPPRN